MEEIKMSLEAIRTQLGWSRAQMAEALQYRPKDVEESVY